MALLDQLEKLYNLRRDRSSGYEKPYKPALLLSLIDLVERGDFAKNRILLTDELIARYAEYLRVVGGPADNARIEYPFWHLCGDGIWMLFDANAQPLYRPGVNGDQSPSVKRIRANLGHAAFDPELFSYVSRPVDREHIRNALIARYFPNQAPLLRALVAEYLAGPAVAEEPAGFSTDPIRSAAFAKVVKEVYDYRCAASGMRFRFGDLTIVDACHLIPFSQSHNDHPTNGIALSKNHHWAFDRHLIAPRFNETGLAWTVSPLLDDRIEGHRELLDLEGRSVLLPKERKFHPNEVAVAWRMERLLRAG